ncbi:MAG: hypothetical protein Q9227_002619 [Pyrenula ochraceoflavens]
MFGLCESPVFDPNEDLPSLSGKTIIITGGTNGLGREHVLQFAKHRPGKLYLAARSQERAQRTISEISSTVGPDCPPIHFLPLELSSFASIRTAASKFLEENDRLDILVNNAGVLALPPSLTADGFEVTFGINYLGPFFFTRLLLPILAKTAIEPNSDVRIVNVTSSGFKFAPKGGFLYDKLTTPLSDISSFARYGQSKLGSLLHAVELARRYPRITSVSLHPGGVATGIADNFQKTLPRILQPVYAAIIRWIMDDVSKGVLGQLWACVAPVEKKDSLRTKNGYDGDAKIVAFGMPEVKNGEYYVPVAKKGPRTKDSENEEIARKLWEWSETQVGLRGY